VRVEPVEVNGLVFGVKGPVSGSVGVAAQRLFAAAVKPLI